MKSFIVLQNNYYELQIALFRNHQCFQMFTASRYDATANLVPLLMELLTQADLTLADIPFIVANQGPGPFTTLRVVIASVNGLNAATGIPLIGIDAFDACLSGYSSYQPLVLLFNAFNQDVYYAIQGHDTLRKGYMKIDELLNQIKTTISEQTTFIGNGAILFREQIVEQLGQQAHFLDPMPDYATLDQIAALGLKKWEEGEGISNQLLPLYLKKHHLQQ